jgi:nucleoside-diphosphate-sugar epimerase
MCHSVPIANQIKRTFERDVTSLLYPGEFEAGQSFIHLDDLVACYDVAVKRRRELPEHLVLLIGEPDIVSYRQMQTIIAEELDRPDWLAPIPKPIAKFGAWAKERVLGEDTFIKPWMVDRADDTYRLDITKAQQILQWQPKHKLQDELPKLVRNFKRDPQAWYRVNRLPMPDWLEQRKAG